MKNAIKFVVSVHYWRSKIQEALDAGIDLPYFLDTKPPSHGLVDVETCLKVIKVDEGRTGLDYGGIKMVTDALMEMDVRPA